MSNYPVILIPNAIRQAKEAMPPVPKFDDRRIEHPGKTPQLIDREMIFGSLAILVIIGIVFGFTKSILGLSLLLMGAVAIAWYGWQQKKSYPKRYNQCQWKIKRYKESQEEYPKLRREHQLAVKNAKNPEKIAEYRQHKLQEILSSTRSYDGKGSNATKGYSEPGVLQYLDCYFPGKIQASLTLKIPNYEHPYTVDFAYIDGGLHIDIEIDEPYAYNTRESTHFVGCWKDERRNDFFQDRGWLVIRFALITSMQIASKLLQNHCYHDFFSSGEFITC